MRNDTQSLWWPRLAAFGLSALAAGSAVFWVLKWPASQPATSLQSAASPISQGADRDVIARALGANAATPGASSSSVARAAPAVVDASSRMALVGVVANAKNGGSALISIDGKPARPFRVGAAVDGDWLLQSVAPRRAVLSSLGNGANSSGAAGANNSVTLELPTLKK